MGDLLRQGTEWLERQRHAHLSSSVSYHRGPLAVALLATIGKTVFEVDGGHGFLERVESRDYLVRAEDLVFGGQAVLPQRGDRIQELEEGVTFIYEVMAPGREPFFRYSDPYRKTLRIHTKLVRRI